MENLDLNKILNREEIYNQIKKCLFYFDQNRNNIAIKRGIYLYGNPGIGKTTFIENLLRDMNYDVIKYDAGDIRNKSVMDTITKHNISDRNVLSMMQKKPKKIVIIMDEIDGMNNGDKGGINSLIKLIRPKKTKKQKLEELTLNPIICIGNYHIDKKIKELIKVCNSFELKNPKESEIEVLIKTIMPSLNPISNKDYHDKIIKKLVSYVQSDLRKLSSISTIYNNQTNLLKNEIVQNIFEKKSYSEDSKTITRNLFVNNYSLDEHINVMNETDRTIIGLLWHENIVDLLEKIDTYKTIPIYTELLNNVCIADYIDRITFQKQIWQFNEMSSLIKTFYNNKIYHNYIEDLDSKLKKKLKINDVRFTKVLTKYSTEYNNYNFIQNLCNQLGMDNKDLICFFSNLKKEKTEDEILLMFENYEINKLDINRIFRYIDKYSTNTLIEQKNDDKSILELESELELELE